MVYSWSTVSLWELIVGPGQANSSWEVKRGGGALGFGEKALQTVSMSLGSHFSCSSWEGLGSPYPAPPVVPAVLADGMMGTEVRGSG